MWAALFLFLMPLVIFTDLDGTLLDGAYSFEAALPALDRVARARVPCVICSSKTRREIGYYRKKLRNDDPFSSENGGGVFVPKGYFDASGGRFSSDASLACRFEVISLGAPYGRLREVILSLRSRGFAVTGFGDMSAEEVAGLTALPLNEAVMAKEREFDEPFLMEKDADRRKEIVRAIEEMGFAVSEGRVLSHLMSDNNKGRAVAVFKDLFEKASAGERVVFAALGDGPNDLSMLESVDYPIVVRRPDGTYDPRLEGRGFAEATGVGPAGWNRAVLDLFSSLSI